MQLEVAPAAGSTSNRARCARTAARACVRRQADRLRGVVLVACVAAGVIACSAAPGGSADAGGIVVEHAWARATPPGAPVAGGYLTLRNAGQAPDRLVSVRSPVAREVQIHEMRHEGGVARMRPIAAGLVVGPGSSVALQPGGAHLMFLDPVRPLVEGDTVIATLQFERAGPIEVRLPVHAMGATGPGEHSDH